MSIDLNPSSEPSTLLHEVGVRLRSRRQTLGLTLKALAEASGLSERYIGLAERGRANLSLEKLDGLARALDLPMAALVDSSASGHLYARLAALEPEALSEVTRWVEQRFGAPGAQLKPPIALLGVRGAGKSTVGQAVARALGRPFVELDARIEALAELSLAEIFAVHGEGYYRRLESEALTELLNEATAPVVATGGSIVSHPESFARLKAETLTVWLKARPEDHWDRVIQQGDRRPMKDHPHAMAELRALLEARAPLYAEAFLTIDTARRTVAEVVAQVVSAAGP